VAFDLDPSYKQVPERIADFKTKHPEGSLRPLNPDKPFELVDVAGQMFIVVCAAAYRHPEDPAPGVGMAWELVPGKTPYTKLSELQNAETSAWGRAIVAVLASESKSVASAEDVRNRSADHQAPDQPREPGGSRRGGPPVCVRCGQRIIGTVDRTSDGFVHKDECPEAPRPDGVEETDGAGEGVGSDGSAVVTSPAPSEAA